MESGLKKKICSVDGCVKPVQGRGLCPMHYARLRKHGSVGSAESSRQRHSNTVCAVSGCEQPTRQCGVCAMHYSRKLLHGEYGSAAPTRILDGKTKHPLYSTWVNMVRRCHDEKSDSYWKYGARGIEVCSEWREDFWQFIKDMGDKPEGSTLDRIDGRLGYEKSNCRWADILTQNMNISRVRSGKLRNVPVLGVTWTPRYDKYTVRIRSKYLGRAADFFEAVCMRKSAECKEADL